jgi:hypothetical protein
MGGVSPKLSVFIIFPGLAKWKSQFEYLGLSDNDIMKLYLLYNKLQVEKAEQIAVLRLLKKFHLEDNAFMTRAMSTLVDKESGNIPNFRDFVFTLWSFCTIERDMGNTYIICLFFHQLICAICVLFAHSALALRPLRC